MQLAKAEFQRARAARSASSEAATASEAREVYAGGAASGLAQLDRPEPERLLASARAAGAEARAADDSASQATFGGAGRRLGAGGASAVVGGAAQTVRVEFYRNGFVVNGGALRSYERDREFVETITSGRLPAELRALARGPGGEIDAELVDKKSEEYVEPIKPIEAFAGAGQKLGGGGGGGESAAAQRHVPSNNELPSAAELDVDESEPTTSLQIRLHDGTRLVAKFNQAHTVAHVRAFVNNSRPGMATVAYKFSTTFPSKVVEDESQTLKAAGLCNAVVVQKKI